MSDLLQAFTLRISDAAKSTSSAGVLLDSLILEYRCIAPDNRDDFVMALIGLAVTWRMIGQSDQPRSSIGVRP